MSSESLTVSTTEISNNQETSNEQQLNTMPAAIASTDDHPTLSLYLNSYYNNSLSIDNEDTAVNLQCNEIFGEIALLDHEIQDEPSSESLEQFTITTLYNNDESSLNILNHHDTDYNKNTLTTQAIQNSKSKPSFIDQLCKLQIHDASSPPGLIRLRNEEYHSFPIFKNETRKLGSWIDNQFFKRRPSMDPKTNNSSSSASKIPPVNNIVPPPHRLEDYVRKQTAEYLENLNSTPEADLVQEDQEASQFSMMNQGLNENWPKLRHKPEIDILYSFDKSALTTVDLDLSAYSANEIEEWHNDDTTPDAQQQHRDRTKDRVKSRAEMIANFVHSDEDVEDFEGGSKSTVNTIDNISISSEDQAKADKLIFELLEQVELVNQILMDSLIVNREGLDILTFPLSHDFEPFGRIKGMLWTISQTSRIIKSIDKSGDPGSVLKYVLKEIDSFRPLVIEIMTECSTLVHEIRVGLKKIKTMLKALEKMTTKVFSFPSFNHSSSIGIYSTEIDATTIQFYEKLQGAAFFDYNKTSIELLWTPNLCYFKGFNEPNWYCLQVESPNMQAKILLALVKLCRRIFLEVKYILEEENEALESHLAPSVQSIHKHLKLIKTKSNIISKASHKFISELKHQIQILYDLYNTMENYQGEFKDGFRWISSVINDVAAMAKLRPEDMDEFLEKHEFETSNESQFPIPIPMWCSNFFKCQQKINSFLQAQFKFILLRVPLQNDIMYKLLLGLTNKPPWNKHAQNILSIMSKAQVSQFKEKQLEEDAINLKLARDPDVIEEIDENVPKNPLTVYNVGHVLINIQR